MDAASRTTSHVDVRHLPRGDAYQGGLANGVPEGEGTYVWAEGSKYAGTWQKGKRNGVGKYTWTSGATYQGEWVDDMMHGVGTFRAVDGSQYAGSWAQNLKHGLGKKTYANGDCYEGLWRDGKCWGPGRYKWADGNQYDGEWEAGKMHGQGTFVWKTGERYDGEWREGQEYGQGIFTWADGSSFDGWMSKGRKHGVGLYRPGPNAKPQAKHLDSQLVAPSDSTSSLGNSNRHHPYTDEPTSSNATDINETPTPPPPAAERRRGTSASVAAAVVPTEAMYVREYKRGHEVRTVPIQNHEAIAMLSSLIGENQNIVRRKAFADKNEKVGEIISSEHRSYELMLDLQLGIRWSVSLYTPPPAPTTSDSADLGQIAHKVKVHFPREGSADTPPHPNGNFKWKDYCPQLFRRLRALFVVDPAEYMLSICGDQALRELPSPGALFYVSHDDRFLIKTMRKNEMRTFLDMLPEYARHVQTNPHTLLTKFFGLHRIQMHGTRGRKIRFIVMGNIFNAEVPIHQKYDLKGSRHGRYVKNKAAAAIWKDLDLDIEIQLPAPWKARLDRQLSADARFLQAQQVMDYSMLVGIHFKARDEIGLGEDTDDSKTAQELATAKDALAKKIQTLKLSESMAKDVTFLVWTQFSRKKKRMQHHSLGKSMRRPEQLAGEELAFRLGEKRVQLGLGMEARAIHKASGSAEDVLVYFGIIDYLQVYSSFKKAEHGLKAVRYDGKAISVVDPSTYAQRFITFVRREAFCGGEKKYSSDALVQSGALESTEDSGAQSAPPHGGGAEGVAAGGQ